MSHVGSTQSGDFDEPGVIEAIGREPNLVRRAVEAAEATTLDARIWALVRLAADLRALGRPRAALGVLDVAWTITPVLEPATATAMFSSAIAAHADIAVKAGETEAFDRGRRIERRWPADMVDLKFARAAARFFWEAYSASQDAADGDRWKHYSRVVDELEARQLAA